MLISDTFHNFIFKHSFNTRLKFGDMLPEYQLTRYVFTDFIETEDSVAPTLVYTLSNVRLFLLRNMKFQN